MSWGEGSMNWAELRDLVDGLPEDSATRAAEAGDEQGQRWTQQTYIQAATYNITLMVLRVLWTAHLKGSPPDLESLSPPEKAIDEEQAQQEAAGRAYSEQLLDQYSPGAAQADQTEIDEWQTAIRELEAAQ